MNNELPILDENIEFELGYEYDAVLPDDYTEYIESLEQESRTPNEGVLSQIEKLNKGSVENMKGIKNFLNRLGINYEVIAKYPNSETIVFTTTGHFTMTLAYFRGYGYNAEYKHLIYSSDYIRRRNMNQKQSKELIKTLCEA